MARGGCAAVSAAFTGARTDSSYLATIVVTMGLTTLLCGFAMFWLGRARFGRIIRFVPYPVFGGFLAITGWYLLRGGLETVVGHPLRLQNLGSVFESGTSIRWLSRQLLSSFRINRLVTSAAAADPIIATLWCSISLCLSRFPMQLEHWGWVLRFHRMKHGPHSACGLGAAGLKRG